MTKITLTDLVNLENQTTAVNAINTNNAVIETAFDNTLSRDGTVPNQMGANLDMNSNQILNIPVPATLDSPVRLRDTVSGAVAITVPPVGTSGAVVPLLNANNTWSGIQSYNANDLVLKGSSSGSTVVNATAVASGTLTLPAATDVVVARNTTDTLTNKTLTSPVLNTATTNSPTITGTVGGTATFGAITINSPTINTPTLSGPTITGNSFLTSSNSGFEIGNLSTPNTPYIDFHSSGINQDFDCRIQSTGGLAGSGQGSLLFNASNVTSTGSLVSQSAGSGIGYTTGSGSSVTQATNKSTGVTLNNVNGQITMNSASLAASGVVSFTLTNSAIAANDVVIVVIKSGATSNAYTTQVQAVAAGSCSIAVRNTSGGNLSEAIVLQFAVIKSVIT